MRLERHLNWDGDEADKFGCDEPSDHGANKHSNQRIDNAFAKLYKMFEKRHLAATLIGCGRSC